MKGSFMPTVAKPVKYRQIYEELSHRIRCGALKPGEQLPSTQELAEYYSTSILTIRQAITHLTRDGFTTAIQGKGTFVSAHEKAKAEVPAIQFFSGSFHGDLSRDPFVGPLLLNLCSQAARQGASVNVTVLPPHQTLSGYVREYGVTPAMRNGTILNLSSELLQTNREAELELLRRERVPYVVIPLDDAATDLPQVRSDGRNAWGFALRRLLDYGHRDIMLLPGHNSYADVQEACRSLDLPVTPERFQLITPWEEESGRAAAWRLLQGGPDFSAVLVAGDRATMGAIRAIQESGRRIPDDISLFSYDRYAWMDAASPMKITGMQQDIDAMAQALLHLLEEQRLSGSEVPRSISIPMQFVAGESCILKAENL